MCDRKLLGGLAQSFVIMGQGIGAVIASIFSDRCVYIPSLSQGRGCGRLHISDRCVQSFVIIRKEICAVTATVCSDRCVQSFVITGKGICVVTATTFSDRCVQSFANRE